MNETKAHLPINGYEEGPGILVTLAGIQDGLQRVVQRVRIHPLLHWPAARRKQLLLLVKRCNGTTDGLVIWK
jgi:hypothetical protein